MMKLALVCSLFVALAFIAVEGQFPKACINTDSLKTKTCCPKPKNFTNAKPCGEDLGRGKCEELSDHEWNKIYDHYDEDNTFDDRHNWPKLFFKRTCTCNPPFSGYDCSKCEFGYRGVDCKEKVTLIRHNFVKMPEEEKDKYMRYVNLSRYYDSDYLAATTFYEEINDTIATGGDPTDKFTNVSIYDLFVWEHYYAARNTFLKDGTEKIDIDFAHDGQGFPTWHRYYLLAWERALQEVSGDDKFTIPFWDWTETEVEEICTPDLLGTNNTDGKVNGKYFDKWYVICTESQTKSKVKAHGTMLCDPRNISDSYVLERAPGADPRIKTLPRKTNVDFALRFEWYDFPPYGKQSSCSFRNLLEGYVNVETGFYSKKAHTMHNQVHLFLGGTMGDVRSASNDPIFLLHHAFVDRIFEKWLRKYKKSASNLSDTEAPIGHNRYDPIVPLFPIKSHQEMFKESFEFGYDYDDIDRNGGCAYKNYFLLFHLRTFWTFTLSYSNLSF